MELAARYFYFQITQVPPTPELASDFAYQVGAEYGYGVYPTGATGGTDMFPSSVTPGNIISMWSAGDQTGNVAVVAGVNATGGTGTVTVMDEDASQRHRHDYCVRGNNVLRGPLQRVSVDHEPAQQLNRPIRLGMCGGRLASGGVHSNTAGVTSAVGMELRDRCICLSVLWFYSGVGIKDVYNRNA